MTPSAADFHALLERVCSGCPEAAREIHDRYGDHLRRVVRRRMHQRLRSMFDSIDFLQQVWASFFRGPPVGQRFETPEALLGYLTRMAQNKVAEVTRTRVYGQRHSLAREQPLRPEIVAEADQPTPSQVAMAQERWDLLLAGQPPQYRAVLGLLREGYTHEEIGERLAIHPKTVQRLLRRLASLAEQP